jgi:hypothetical protein
MAKLTARGAHEVAAYTTTRTITLDGVATVYCERWALRSDGWILSRILWVQDPTRNGGERSKHTSGYSQWRRLKDDRAITADTLLGVLTRRGWAIVDEAAERRETAARAQAKRKANAGPVESDRHWSVLYVHAQEAGEMAADAARPTPMVVVEHASPLDDASPIVRADVVPDGPCGSAYVTVRPGNGSFARWAKRTHGWTKAYGGGLMFSVHAYGQSVTRKEAYARAFAGVLHDAGVKAYSSTWVN